MHVLILLMIAVAQDPAVRKTMAAKLDAMQPRLCSIPLLNAIVKNPGTDRMSVKKSEGTFHIRQVTPPAPPCENWGK